MVPRPCKTPRDVVAHQKVTPAPDVAPFSARDGTRVLVQRALRRREPVSFIKGQSFSNKQKEEAS
jgi:hypothetical protein